MAYILLSKKENTGKTRHLYKEQLLFMFRREVSKNLGENYCPILQLDILDNEARTSSPARPQEAAAEKTATRSEIFILAANIYTRARKSPHVRAAGIL